MYLEFRLPSGSGGMAAGMLTQRLKKALNQWADAHHINYKSKIYKYTLRVTFDDERLYSFFLASWDGTRQNGWFKAELKDPMKLDRYD